MKPYYYVFKPGSNCPPTKKHETLESAVAESERLANQHPAQCFEICKVIAVTQCSKPSTFWMDGETGLRDFQVGDKVEIIDKSSALLGYQGEVTHITNDIITLRVNNMLTSYLSKSLILIDK